MLLNPREARKKLGISDATLHRWEAKGKIKTIKTPGGHRRYEIPFRNEGGKKILYARVSSQKQAEDLQRQIAFLKEKYPDYEVKSDIGSGINYERKEFKWILEQLFEGNIYEVVVASRDRFARVSGGSDFFTWIFEKFGGKLTILQDTVEKTGEQRMAEELIEVITVYAASYHGKRKYKNRAKAGTNTEEVARDNTENRIEEAKEKPKRVRAVKNIGARDNTENRIEEAKPIGSKRKA